MRGYLCYDIRQGMGRQAASYLLSAAFALVSCILFFRGYVDGPAAFLDYAMYFFMGQHPYRLQEGSVFLVPLQWLGFYICLFYITGGYARQDFDSRGMYSLLAGKSREKWWLSKCAWCFLSVLAYFGTALLTILAFVLCTGGRVQMHFTMELLLKINTGAVLIDDGEAVLVSLLLPFAVTLAACMLQMFLSFAAGPVGSFVLMCVVYILSTYYMSPWLLGNYAMWARSSLVAVGDGMDAGTGLFVSGILTAASVFGGLVLLGRRDVLGTAETGWE